MEEAIVDDEISQQGLAHISIYIMSARSLPRAQAQRLPDAFVSATLDGHTASTTCVGGSDTPTFRSHVRLPLRAGGSLDSVVRVCVYDMSGALVGGQPLGHLAYTLRGLRTNYESGEVNDGFFDLHGAAGAGSVVPGADGGQAALQIRIEYVAARHEKVAAPVAPGQSLQPSPGPSVAMPAKAHEQSSPVAAQDLASARSLPGTPALPPAAGAAGAQKVLVDVLSIRSLPQVNDAVCEPYVELRLGSQKTRSGVHTSELVNESLQISVEPGQEKGRLIIAVVDAVSGSDLGEQVFPVHKLAAAGSVQGWYNCKKPGTAATKGAPDALGWNPTNNANDGEPLSIKCKVTVQ